MQYLRGIAATMVAYFHLVGQVPSLAPYIERDLLGYDSLASGVDVFFVISGFIMLLTTQRSSPADFMMRRVIRVAPLYWLLTLVVVGVALARPEVLRTTQVDWRSALASLLFIPYANPGHGGDVVPILVPGWSLNFEMFFYAIFALVLFCRSPLRRVLINGGVFLALIGLHELLPPQHPVLEFLTNWRIVEFWIGMLIALLYIKQVGTRQPIWLSIVLLVSGFTVLIFHPTTASRALEELGFTLIPAAAIVWSTVALESRGALPNVPLLTKLGDASYSIYLSHVLVLGICRALWQHLALPTDSLAAASGFASAAMLIVLCGGILVYRGLERPLTDRLHRRHPLRASALPT